MFAPWGVGWQIFMLTVTVAGPPFFYNFFLWLGENASGESRKARLAASAAKGAEVWSPFWVAVGPFVSRFTRVVVPEFGRNSISPEQFEQPNWQQ